MAPPASQSALGELSHGAPRTASLRAALGGAPSASAALSETRAGSGLCAFLWEFLENKYDFLGFLEFSIVNKIFYKDSTGKLKVLGGPRRIWEVLGGPRTA